MTFPRSRRCVICETAWRTSSIQTGCVPRPMLPKRGGHARILSGDDPLARLNRMAAPERKPPIARMPENVSRDSGRREKPERNIWIGIAITAAVICLIALIPIISL